MARANRYNPNTGKKYNPNDVLYIATHEAGHAVSAFVLGLEFNGVDIKQRRLPDGNVSLGFTDSPVPGDIAGKGEDAGMPHLVQTAAGPLAEGIIAGHGIDEPGWQLGYQGDIEAGRRIAYAAVCGLVEHDGQFIITPEEQARQKPRVDALINRSCELADSFVRSHRMAIVAVASALIERKAPTAAEVAAIVEANPPAP